jgi:Holliday junction resolvase RusA-like endonuclease
MTIRPPPCGQTMDELVVTIPGQPVPKGRPRMTRAGHTYTPLKTRSWESVIQSAVVEARFQGDYFLPFAGPVSVRVTAYFEIPVSWPAWKRKAALGGSLRHTGTPDLDNILKLVMDAVNGSGTWADDSYVVGLSATKDYSATPRTVITITRAAGTPSQTTSRESSK